MRPGGKRALLAIAVVSAGASVVHAAGGQEGDAPSAVAHVLPRGYSLVLTEESGHGSMHVARYGPVEIEAGDAPLAVTSLRGEARDDQLAGDEATTVRGHAAVLRTLTDEEKPYAKELVWRERADLLVKVTADLPIRERRLAEI